MKIKKILGREILDSRGNPTVEAEVVLSDGSRGRGCAPSGASTGKFEALEMRDADSSRYGGKGVKKAASQINTAIRNSFTGASFSNPYEFDKALIKLDGSKNKSNIGANVILALSIAFAKAVASSYQLPLFQYLGGVCAAVTPVPMMNVLNGGAHAGNNIDIQEFMIMPVGASSFSMGLMWCSEVYHTLKSILKENKLSTAVGDEGGFAPDMKSDREALEYLLKAIEKAGYKPGKDFVLALDAAASEWKSTEKGLYYLPKSKKEYKAPELIAYWENLCSEYPIKSIEDGADEEDYNCWKELTKRLGRRIQLVGDDLFVTNPEKIKKGIECGIGNAVLIKPNQIGTVTETVNAVLISKKAGYNTIVSHRSGETEDTTIADIAVGLGTGQIKTGAPCRGERTAKYNRLLRISSFLGKREIYPGFECFS
ncbi:MAG: phosphopyruvate hydratase [Ruminococcus sp.]